MMIEIDISTLDGSSKRSVGTLYRFNENNNNNSHNRYGGRRGGRRGTGSRRRACHQRNNDRPGKDYNQKKLLNQIQMHGY